MRQAAPVLQALAKLSEVKVFDDEAVPGPAAKPHRWPWSATRTCALHVEIDVAAEKARLGKEAARLAGRDRQGQRQARQRGFVAKAPPAVIEQERKRIADFSSTLTRVSEQLARLG